MHGGSKKRLVSGSQGDWWMGSHRPLLHGQIWIESGSNLIWIESRFMFTWDPCAVNPGTFNRVSNMAYELRIVLLSAFIACMLWLLRQRRLRQRKMLEIQRLRSVIEREREVYRLGRQRRRRIRMSHTVFVVSRHFKRSEERAFV